MSDEIDAPESTSTRIDRMSPESDSESTRTGLFLKITSVLATYTLAAWLFHLPPFKPLLPATMCNNLASTSTESVQMKREVAVVISPTDTFLDFGKVIDSEKQGLFKKIIENDTKLTIVLADGDPKVLTSADIHAGSGENLEFKIRDAVSKVQASYECVVSDRLVNGQEDKIPSVVGEDVLRGLQIATKSFTANVKNRQIIVISNGIQTAGAFRLQDGFPAGASGAARLAEKLKQAGSLVDMNDAQVTWVGLGQADGVNQKRLDTYEIYSLERLWNSIISTSGGLPIDISEDTLPASEPNSRSVKSPSVQGLPDPCIFVEAGDDDVKFLADSSKFLNPKLAGQKASEIASQIRKRGCTTQVTITGYVASSTSKSAYAKNPNAGCDLSLARADAFKYLLVQSGINIPIETAAGCKGPHNDWDDSGNFDETLGKLNRMVTVTQ